MLACAPWNPDKTKQEPLHPRAVPLMSPFWHLRDPSTALGPRGACQLGSSTHKGPIEGEHGSLETQQAGRLGEIASLLDDTWGVTGSSGPRGLSLSSLTSRVSPGTSCYHDLQTVTLPTALTGVAI